MNFIPDNFSPGSIAMKIATNVRKRRLSLNLTQEAMARRSGVSLGSLKRFENQGEISLKNLLRLAVAFNATDEFLSLFEQPPYQSVEDVIKEKYVKTRKRGRKND